MKKIFFFVVCYFDFHSRISRDCPSNNQQGRLFRYRIQRFHRHSMVYYHDNRIGIRLLPIPDFSCMLISSYLIKRDRGQILPQISSKGMMQSIRDWMAPNISGHNSMNHLVVMFILWGHHGKNRSDLEHILSEYLIRTAKENMLSLQARSKALISKKRLIRIR